MMDAGIDAHGRVGEADQQLLASFTRQFAVDGLCRSLLCAYRWLWGGLQPFFRRIKRRINISRLSMVASKWERVGVCVPTLSW